LRQKLPEKSGENATKNHFERFLHSFLFFNQNLKHQIFNPQFSAIRLPDRHDSSNRIS
jgi:hypothetical protein